MVKVQVPNTQLVNVSFPSLSFNSYLQIIYYVPGSGLIAKTKQTPCLHRIYFSLGKIDKQAMHSMPDGDKSHGEKPE